jgi:predicted permease
LIGRLKPDVSPTQATEAVRVMVRRLDRAYPKETFHEATVLLKPFWQSPVGAQAIMGPIMIALGGVVIVVLLLACSNAVGVMLLENALRRRDLSIRLALGARSRGLIGYCLAESVLVSVLAAAAGLLITRFAADNLRYLVPDIQFPVKLSFPVSGSVLGFSIIAGAAASLFCGLWSGIEARWQSVAVNLRSDSGSTTTSRERSRLRALFVGAQVALSFLLLSSAGLIYRSVERARSVNLGFDANSVSIVRIDLAGNRYRPEDGTAMFQKLLSRLSLRPEVESASLAKSVPLGFGDQERVKITPELQQPVDVWGNRVSPGYFATLGIPLLAGREFNESDSAGSGRVAIVNEALGGKIWKQPFPVGSSFFVGDKRYRIVGVVRNTKIWSLTAESQPLLYLPLYQAYTPSVAIHVKSKHPSTSVLRLVEGELAQQDPQLPVVAGHPLTQQVEIALFPQRIAMVMLGIFSLLGAYLAAVGLYGVIAHAARSRTKEIAIRVALGATAAQVRWLVTREAVRLVGSGVCVGAVMAIVLSRVLQSVLVGSDGIDPASLAGTALTIALVALAATWIPMFRAGRVQAAIALRAE